MGINMKVWIIFGWIWVVVTAALVIHFKSEDAIIDHIFVFSILVLAFTVLILRFTVEESTLSGISYNVVKSTVLEVTGIRQVQNLRFWSLTTDKTGMESTICITVLTKYKFCMSFWEILLVLSDVLFQPDSKFFQDKYDNFIKKTFVRVNTRIKKHLKKNN